MTREDIIKLPKVELHCHLDGSLSREFVEKRLGRQVGKEELSVSNDCTSLAEYLEKFDLPGQCLQDEEGLEEAGYDVLRSMKQENVIYSEIRFAPLLSETDDMNCNKVIEAVLRGLERGKKEFEIDFGLIVCAMRHHSEEMNWRMIRTAREYLGSGVCAADLAGAEAIYPMSEFKNLFQNTHKIGMPFTIHAGECGSAQNIIDSVEAGARRIGHGIAMRGHSDLIKELAEKESCIIVGRCANYILRDNPDVLSVFVHADDDFCLARAMERNSFSEKETKKFIERTDKYRSDFYHYHTGHHWTDARYYDLCLDSSKLGFEKCVEEIEAYAKIRFGK